MSHPVYVHVRKRAHGIVICKRLKLITMQLRHVPNGVQGNNRLKNIFSETFLWLEEINKAN